MGGDPIGICKTIECRVTIVLILYIDRNISSRSLCGLSILGLSILCEDETEREKKKERERKREKIARIDSMRFSERSTADNFIKLSAVNRSAKKKAVYCFVVVAAAVAT